MAGGYYHGQGEYNMEQLAHTSSVRYEDGFTLIELMVALAIFGIVLAGIVTMFIQTAKYHTGQEMMVTTSQDLRAAKMLMVQEIREAGLNPTAVAEIGFQLDSDVNSIHFTRDQCKIVGSDCVDGYDGNTDNFNQNISYYRTDDDCILGAVGAVLPAGVTVPPTPGCLRRNTGGGGQSVMPNVTNLQFVYLDDANIPIPPPFTISTLEDIRTVEVTLTGQVEDPARVVEAEQTLTFRILARNM